MAKLRVLAVVFPRPQDAASAAHFDASSSILEFVDIPKDDDTQVKLLQHADFAEFRQAIADFQPNLVYLTGHSSYDAHPTMGCVSAVQFADGAQPAELLAASLAGIETVYLDAASYDQLSARLQQAGVQHSIVWPEDEPVPVVTAAQFSHTFFCSLLQLRTTVHESFALASHCVQAHCTTIADNAYVPPALPALFSPLRAQLPDNSSIPNPVLPGIDSTVPLASAIPGWADIRLLAPRAELKLLLTGNVGLIDGQKLSFLGEAIRALLVLEMRGLVLISSSPCVRTPANLPAGCTALRCEVRTTSGATVAAILGGQPSVLGNHALVEHALRMTLVADSLSLQFRLAPPSMGAPVARTSSVVAGGVPVVDTLVSTSVWAVQVLRSSSLNPAYKPLISLGLGAVGGTATTGVSGIDAQRLKLIVYGTGPAMNMYLPVQQPAANMGLIGMDGMQLVPGTENFLTAAL